MTILLTEAFHVFQQKQIFGIPTTFSATAVFSHGFFGQHNPPRSRAIPAHFDPMALTHDACSVFFSRKGFLKLEPVVAQITSEW